MPITLAAEGGRRYCGYATKLQQSFVDHDAARRIAEHDCAPLTAEANGAIAAGATALRESCTLAPTCFLNKGEQCPITSKAFEFLRVNTPGPSTEELFGV